MNPKFKVTFVCEVGEECESIEQHIEALSTHIKIGAFANLDIAIIGDVEVEEFHG